GGGLLRRSSTRIASRSDSTIRSGNSRLSRAAGKAARMINVVTSSRSRAAAWVRSSFSSGVVLSSIRAVRAAFAMTIASGLSPHIAHGQCPYNSRAPPPRLGEGVEGDREDDDQADDDLLDVGRDVVELEAVEE